jgi:hypothetical protein
MTFVGSSIHGWHRLGIVSIPAIVRTFVGGTDLAWGDSYPIAFDVSAFCALRSKLDAGARELPPPLEVVPAFQAPGSC